MEEPEKIYLTQLMLFATPTIRSSDNEVEYVRKDVLIKKACEYWYQYNRDIVKRHGAKAVLGCREFTVNVEDFKKYLKGE